MRRLIVGEFVTIDGVMQAPGAADEDTEGGFVHGGWTWPYWHDDIGARFMEVMDDCDAFLLGRKTWEIHGTAFEAVPEGDAFGDIMNAKQKYVVSRTLTSTALWRKSTLITGDVIAEVRKLKEMPGKNIYLDGSHELVHLLAPQGLIDEYSLLVYPLVLASGKRLFPDGVRLNLELVENRRFPTGVVLQRYVPAS